MLFQPLAKTQLIWEPETLEVCSVQDLTAVGSWDMNLYAWLGGPQKVAVMAWLLSSTLPYACHHR